MFCVTSESGEGDGPGPQTRLDWVWRCGVLSRRGVFGKEGKAAAAIARPKGFDTNAPMSTVANALNRRHVQPPKWTSKKIAPSTAVGAETMKTQGVSC